MAIPEDAYTFVRALDELIRELAAGNFGQKLEETQGLQKLFLTLILILVHTLYSLGQLWKNEGSPLWVGSIMVSRCIMDRISSAAGANPN